MTILHVPVFQGMVPRVAPRKLDKFQSQIARNCDLFSGDIRPLNDLSEVNTPTKAGTKLSIYLLGDLWLHWITDVDVVRSPLFLENELRVHYTGDYNPKSTDNTLADASGTDYPTDFYRLGIPQPDTAPTVAHTGGTANDVERSYVYTFVSAWGEEGPPSAAGTHVGKADATSWDITTIDATPPNQWTHAADIASITSSTTTVTVTLNSGSNHFLETTEYVVISGTTTGTGTLFTDIIGTWQVTRVSELIFTFTVPVAPTGTYTGGAVIDREAPLQLAGWTKRLYRTIGGNFRFVADGITGTSYTDTVADDDLGELLPGGLDSTQWWKAPNGNLSGLNKLPGGVMAGFYGNTLSLSVPNVPSAWPEANKYTFNNEVVAIGIMGNSVVVATDGFPSIVTGDDPALMDPSELEVFQACVSKRSMVSVVNGVLYASPDGYVYVPSAGMPTVITEKHFKRKDWQLLAPSSIVAEVHDDRVYAFYNCGGQCSELDEGFIFDMKEPGSTFTQISFSATGLYSDLETDELYLIREGDIVQWDSGGQKLIYTWLSKTFTTAKPVAFKAAQVKVTLGADVITEADLAAVIAAAIAELEVLLAATALSSSFGAENNYVSGAFGGGAVALYDVAGGPYYSAISPLVTSTISSLFLVHAYFDNGDGEISKHTVHQQTIFGSKPFRVGNVIKGILADQWEVEMIASDITVHEIMLGTSMKELARA